MKNVQFLDEMGGVNTYKDYCFAHIAKLRSWESWQFRRLIGNTAKTEWQKSLLEGW
jgi:hypothetical protein